MNRKKRNIVLIGLVLAIFITSCTCTEIGQPGESSDMAAENIFVPLLPDESSESEIPEKSERLYDEPANGIVIGVDILTYDEALASVKRGIINRETYFSIDTEVMNDDVNTVLTGIYNSVIAPTGKPDEGDYIYMSIKDINMTELKTLYSGARPYVHYEFELQYYSTKEQEDAVGEEIASVLNDLDIRNMNSDYDKVLSIYQWITEHVTYDEEHAEDPDYVQQYSAYGALIDRTAVCQGCCALFYRMLLTADVDCRCIIGDAGGTNHAWNIVCIDGIWYNADVTWDLGKDPGNYDYFLKGSDTFDETHYRSEIFTTEEFYNTYPVSPTDY